MANLLIVHAGFHKTGTTALQSSLKAQRAELAAAGILYPDTPGATGHHHAVWALSGRHWGWKDHGGEKTPENVWNSLAWQVRQHPGTAVLSSEFLVEASDKTIRRLVRDTAPRQIKAVFTIRPLADILPSAYQQSIKSGRTASYVRWLKQVFDSERKTANARSFWLRHDYTAVVARWAEIIGIDNIQLIITDKRHPKRIFKVFSALVRLPEEFLQPVSGRGLNRSLKWPEIELLREVNKSFDRSRGWREYVTLIRSSAVRSLTDSPPLVSNDPPLQTPAWAVETAQQIAAGTVHSFQRMGIVVHGDLDSLTQANIPIGRNKSTGQVSTKVAATMLLATNSARILRRAKTKKLLAELSRRLRRRILPKWLRV